MPNLPRSAILLFLLSGMLVIETTACSSNAKTDAGAENSPTPSVPPPTPTPTPKVSQEVPKVEIDTYKLAMDKAEGTSSISQSAQSADDWNLVAKRWQQAISLLKQVPASSSNKKLVPAKLAEFESKLKKATEEASILGQKEPIIEKQPKLPTFFRVPIKRRLGGIPVIEVVFNGSQKFEMID